MNRSSKDVIVGLLVISCICFIIFILAYAFPTYRTPGREWTTPESIKKEPVCQCDCQCEILAFDDLELLDLFCEDCEEEESQSEIIDYDRCIFERREIKLWSNFWKEKYQECRKELEE